MKMGEWTCVSSESSDSCHDAKQSAVETDGDGLMVVGPPHIGSLMTSLEANTHVRHFLLGKTSSDRQEP